MKFMTGALAFALIVVPVFANDNIDTYLALGDSVSFGFDPTLFAPGRPLPTPANFTGYPEIVGDVLQLRKSKKEINASCPGETSGSFLNVAAPDNGCNHPHVEPGLTLPPFKSTIGLHAPYLGPQVAFAVSQLATNKKIDLVTLSIGGNDLLLVVGLCATVPDFAGCVRSTLTNVVFPAYAQNLGQILGAIRIGAGYQGKLILMKYYAINTDPLFTEAVEALNAVMVQVGNSGFNVKYADGFNAFKFASAWFQRDPCKAGLLIRLSPTTCDVHPSRYGQSVLAATTLLTIVSR